jgi:hypothetical protein
MARSKTKAQTKKIVYKPQIQALVRRQATLAAKEVEQVQQIHKRRIVERMVIRGKSYDAISRRLGISAKEALDITKEITQKWLTDEALDALTLREIEIKRLDALHALAMYEAFPHPMTDDFGQPIMVKTCDCPVPVEFMDKPPDQRPKACIFEDHNKPAMSGPSKQWAEMVLEIDKRRSALLGLDAAAKLEEKKVDLMERVYRGVDAKTIDQI